MIEQRGETGHGQVQVFTDLAAHGNGLLDKVPPMPRSELQFPVG